MSALEKITARAQSEVAEAFYESARTNAEASGGLLKAYAPDFERFPYQSLSFRKDRRIVDGEPLSPKKAFEVAQLVDPRCKGLELAFEDCQARSGALSSMANVIMSGQNIVPSTDHLDLVDIAFFAVGASASLHNKGAAHRSGLVLSKAASDYLGVDLESFDWPLDTVKEYLTELGLECLEDNTVPVRDFLKLAVDLQFLVIPNTGSFSSLRGLQEDAVEAHNALVKRDINNSMSRRGMSQNDPMALYVALPGTKTKQLDLPAYRRNEVVPGFHETFPEHIPAETMRANVIGRISTGVCEYASDGLAYASIIRLENNKAPYVAIDPEFEVLRDDVSVLSAVRKLMKLIDARDNTTTLYDIKGNLPIKAHAT
jgi:hypothetical protein